MRIHIIKPGDSLYSLASKYHVTVDDIMKLNPNINANNLQVGSKIRIPSASHSNQQQVEIVHQHIIKPGDSFWKLSQAWGVTLDELVAVNKHIPNPNALNVGDVINIPKAGQGHATQGQGQATQGQSGHSQVSTHVGQLIEQLIPGLNYYTVVAGDTLYKIAQNHNISLDVLVAFNPQLSDPNKLTVGMKVVIPSGAALQTGTVQAQSTKQAQALGAKAQALSTKAQLTSPMQQGKAAQTAPMIQPQAAKPQAQSAAKPAEKPASKPSFVQQAAKAAAKKVVDKVSANKVQSLGKVEPVKATKTQALGTTKLEATQAAKLQSNSQDVKVNIGGKTVAASENKNSNLSQQLVSKSNTSAMQQAPITTKVESLSNKVASENKGAVQSTKVAAVANKLAPLATGNNVASLATGNNVASMATGNNVASMATGNNVASMATGNNVASMATENKVASLAAENKVASLAAENKVASLAAENKVASMAAENKVASLAAENKVASMATGNKIASMAAENKVASLATGNKIASLAAENKVASMATGNKIASLATENKVASLATENKVASMAEKGYENKLAPLATTKVSPVAHKVAPISNKVDYTANKAMNYAAKVEKVAQSPYYSNKPFPNQIASQGNEGFHPYQVNASSYLNNNHQYIQNTPVYAQAPTMSPYQTGYASPNQYGQMQSNQLANQYGQMQSNQHQLANQYGQMQNNQFSNQQAHLNSVGGFTAQSAMYPPMSIQGVPVAQPMAMYNHNCGCGGNGHQVPLYQYANHQANDANVQVQDVAIQKAAATKKKGGKKVMITQHEEAVAQQKRDGRPWMNI